MDALARTIDTAVQNNDYASVAAVFSYGPSSWQSVGQGEQRSLAAHFIKIAVGSPGFLPKAFSSGSMMQVMLEALAHLPSTVDGAADNTLRQMIFDYKVNEEADYSAAAKVLSGMRMEDDEASVYYTNPADKCDVYVKIAECFLEEDAIGESDSAVTKAGSVVESIPNPDQHMALILRYKSTYARILDSNRKFLQAASRYHDLSQSSGDLIRAEDLLVMLGRAATCAILAPSGPQRQRVLGHIYKDGRLSQLDSIPQFETHSTILSKMYKNQVLGKEELTKFEASLQPHQRAVMGDGLTLMERGVVEHNMIAVSKIYQSIYVSELALVLGVNPHKAEKIAASMIMEGSLAGSIDQVEGLVEFQPEDSAHTTWDKAISNFCVELNRVTDAIQSN
jgi:COP9 signalosome complex subunit 4